LTFRYRQEETYPLRKKTSKYDIIQTEFMQRFPSIDISIHIVSIKPDYSDLEIRFFELCRYLSVDIQCSEVFLRMRFFSDKIKLIQEKLKSIIQDDRLISQHFSKEFGTDDKEVETLQFNADQELISRIENLYNKNKENCTRNKVLAKHEKWVMGKLEATNKMDNLERSAHFELKFTQHCEDFKDLLNDKYVIDTFKEKKTSVKKISDAIEKLHTLNESFPKQQSKPIHQLYTPIWSKKTKINLRDCTTVPLSIINKLRLEQAQIVMMLDLFKTSSSESLPVKFVNEIATEVIGALTGKHSEFNIEMFNTSNYLSVDTEKMWRTKYEHYKQNCKENHTPVQGYVDFLKSNDEDVPKMHDARSYKQKMFRIPLSGRTEEFTEFWKESHSGYSKEKKVQTETRSSCSLSQADEIDDIMDLLSEKVELQSHEADIFSKFFSKLPSNDEPILQDLKDKMVGEFKPVMQELRMYKGYHYLMAQCMVAEQLMHFNQFTLPSNTMSFFTCGFSNLLYIVNNSYHDKGKDVGKAFMVVGFTDDERWFNSSFGKTEHWQQRLYNKDVFLFCTKWRRIETYKVTFLKDQFFCILSTSMNGLLRNKSMVLDYDHIENKDEYSREIVRHHFVLKIVLGMTTNQKIAEMLADMRYAIMASFSEYSEIERLIIDKFSPPYNTTIEAWIAMRMVNLKRQADDFVEKNIRKTFFKQPVFYNGQRSEESIGGKFDIPSIWTGLIIHDLQDLLDDMFIYVHTLKEPSSIHHENVKAVNTILEYQDKYSKMSEERKCGYGKLSAIREMLMDPENNIGHNSDILATSVHRTMESIKGVDWEHKMKKHFSESICDITSTKAAIPEYERELIDESERDIKKKSHKGKKMELSKSLFMQEYAKYKNAEVKERPLKMLRTKISKESSLPNKNRSKVHDCILDVIEQNNHITTVFDMAEWNICKNGSKTLADICIKAQYGAKREFYVINVGSKACARVLENMFEEICKQLPNEMISVPGDKKLLKMQEFINKALSKKSSKDRVFFVNGDCTKWSAAETMECFMSMLRGLSGFVPHEYIKYMSTVIMMWGNKNITIPISLLQNTFFTTSDKTKYLETHKASLQSDQNFLQGMFNYMSSFKAVCSSNMTQDIWKSIRPDSTISVEHMEHSDDYSLIVTTKSLEELEELRTLHRMVMKCHGFNDSVKKTNTQQFLMEFISLVSLNGHMTYPHIKKLKECGMNLGCTGYRDDMDGAMSRVGESVRVGTILTSSYFMQRCHIANVCRSYSLLEGQRNNTMGIKEMCNLPVEMFGIPDTHPIFSLLCKGSTNNYRLYKYGGDVVHTFLINDSVHIMDNASILRNLFIIEKKETDDRNLSNTVDFTEGVRLFHPRYTFDQENKLIKKIRSKVKMSFEENLEFWQNHKSYNFVKPKNRDLLIDWMRAMYFRHSFAMAYSRNSRAQVTLRLSTYTSKECCVVNQDDDGNLTYESILGYMERFLSNTLPIKHKGYSPVSDSEWLDIEKSAMNSDSTVSSIQSFFRDSRILPHGSHTRMTISTLTPPKINWLNIDNSASSLSQYMFNYDDFLKDMREHKGLPSLSADQSVIENFYGREMNDDVELSTIKSVYTDITLSKDKRNLCMSYSNNSQTLEDFLSSHIEFGSIYKKRFQVVTSGVKEAVNPHSGEKYYRKFKSTTKNPNRALIDDAALLYSVLRHSSQLDPDLVRRILNTLEIKDINDTESPPHTFSDLMQKGMQDLKIMGFPIGEMKTFAFMKAFMLNDSTDITRLASDNLMFSYQYEKLSGIKATIFSESVIFNYQNCMFRGLRVGKTSHIILEIDNEKRHLLTDAYLIAQKLFGVITQSQMEKTISTVTIKGLMFSKNIKKLGELIHDVDLAQYIRSSNTQSSLIEDPKTKHWGFKYNSIDEVGMSLFFFIGEIEPPSVGQNEQINKTVSVDWEQNSVFMGTKKLFTLPVLACQQSNLSYIRSDVEINGLYVNWWLQESRLRNFVHEDEISITRDVFEQIGGFKLSSESFMLSLSGARNFERLVHLPSIKLFINKDEVIDKLKHRIKKTRMNIEEAREYDNQVEAKKKDIERIRQEKNKGKLKKSNNKIQSKESSDAEGIVKAEGLDEELTLSKKINWADAFSSMGNIGASLSKMIADNEENSRSSDEETDNNEQLGPGMHTLGGMTFNFEEPFDDDDYPFNEYDGIDMTVNEVGDLSTEALTALINLEGGLNPTFKVVDIEDDSDKEDFDKDFIKEGESDGSNKSEHDGNNEQYLSFKEFQNMVPKIEARDIIFTSGKSHSTQKLRRLGEPTQYLISKNFIDDSTLSVIKVKDKVALLYRLKSMLELADFLSDHELLLSLTLLSNILKSLSSRDEWSISEDYILTIGEESEVKIMIKHCGRLTDEQATKVIDKGGRFFVNEGKGIYHIPLPEERILKLLDNIMDSLDVFRFFNIRPLEDCFFRLYKEPFKRIGLVSTIISELI